MYTVAATNTKLNTSHQGIRKCFAYVGHFGPSTMDSLDFGPYTHQFPNSDQPDNNCDYTHFDACCKTCMLS